MSAIGTTPVRLGRSLAPFVLDLSPELELLLLCARRNLSDHHAQRVTELLYRPLNWSRLLHLAESHRLVPLLYRHLAGNLKNELPQAIAAEVEHRFRRNVAHSMLLVRDLARVVDLLARRGIPAIPFKGPTLALSLYGDPCLRDSVDLDFLIQRRHVPEAIAVLISAGYDAPKRIAAGYEKAFVARQYEYGLLSPSGTLIELQWRIVPHYFSLAIPEAEYWNRIRRVVIDGCQLNSLSPEDLLLLLCFHGGKHRWERLIWVADVAELIASNPQLDWPYVLAQARFAGGLRMMLLGVRLSKTLLGCAVPEQLQQALFQDGSIGQLAAAISGDILASERHSYIRTQLYLLHVRERWRDRLRYILRFAFTDTPLEWELVELPTPLNFLYRVLRVMRGLVKGSSLAANAISQLMRERL